MILDKPESFVWFAEFGDNSLNFELHFFIEIRNMMERRRVESDIRYKINELLNEARITIAFPQRDVHLDMPAQLERGRDFRSDVRRGAVQSVHGQLGAVCGDHRDPDRGLPAIFADGDGCHRDQPAHARVVETAGEHRLHGPLELRRDLAGMMGHPPSERFTSRVR